MTDAQLDMAYRNRASLPDDERTAIEEAHADMVRRRDAQRAGRPVVATPAPGDYPDSVESSASSIAVEPEVGPRKWQEQTDEEILANLTTASPTASADELPAYAGRYRQALVRQGKAAKAAHAARADAGLGRQDPDQQAYDDATGLMPPSSMATQLLPDDGTRPAWASNAFASQMINVDGVMVPAYDLGDGKLRYRLGDVKNAQATAQEAQMAAEWDRQAKADIAAYGTQRLFEQQYTADGGIARNHDGTPSVTPVGGIPGIHPGAGALSEDARRHQQNLIARKEAEARQYRQNRALALEPGRKAYEDRQRARRDLVAQNAMLAGGAQNLNPVMRAQIGAINMANDPNTDPAVARSLRYTLPNGRLAAEVDARQADQVMKLLQGQNIGRMVGQGNALEDAQAEAQQIANNAQMLEQRSVLEAQLAEQYAPTGTFGYDEFTLDEQQAMYDELVSMHRYTDAQARATVSRIAQQRRATQKLFGAEPRK